MAYTAKHDVQHNGKAYAEGEKIPFVAGEEADVEQLLECKAISGSGKLPKPGDAPSE